MGMDSGDLSDFVENVEWEVHGMPAAKNVITYGCCSDPYPDITYTLLLKRRSSFYIFNLLIPCVMISFLAPLGFFLPADSGEKVSLGVTVLLALTVFQLMVAESMPPSESVPLIGKYYIATMTMITASTALTIFIMNIHHCGAEAKPVPDWAKVFILDYMSKIFFVYEVGENCTTSQKEKEKEVKLQMEETVNGKCKKRQDAKVQAEASKCNNRYNMSAVEENPNGCLKEELCPEKMNMYVCTCAHHDKIAKNIAYIANCFREQKATCAKGAEWKKVAKVMDRFFMWVFFIMVFLMSISIIR